MKVAKTLFRLSSILACICMIALVSASAESFTRVDRPSTPLVQSVTADRGTDAHQYTGYFRIYVVEPTSRYTDYNGQAYEFGFLGFALNQSLTLNYGDTLMGNAVFNGSNMAENNVKVIAVVSNSEGHTAYSNPPSGYPFTAHYVDAAATALPGETGEDNASGSYTHNVFVEEGTAHG
jgi:hypothetical protein